MVNEREELSVGDRVLVPWGLEEVEGEIVEVYSSGLGPRARVRVVDDPSAPTIALPLDSLAPMGSRGGGGYIAVARDYERRVGSALKRAQTDASLRHPGLEMRRSSDRILDTGADFEFSIGKRRLFVQVKYFASSRRVSTDTISTAAGLADASTGVLLVVNQPLGSAAQQRLEQLWSHRTRVWYAVWRSPRDDAALVAALNKIILSWK